MSESLPSQNSLHDVTVQLLDTTSGRPIKSWAFNDQTQITIGRSPDQDVEMSDPYISRTHASLVFRDGQWRLVSLGRNGVVVGDQLVKEYPVSGDVTFRLGMEGPTLRFRATPQEREALATICFDVLPVPVFELDESRLRNDVEEIAEGKYFQSLQQRVKQMRGRRSPE